MRNAHCAHGSTGGSSTRHVVCMFAEIRRVHRLTVLLSMGLGEAHVDAGARRLVTRVDRA